MRWVGYSLYHSEFKQKHQSPYGPLVYLNPEDDITLTTRNFLCELDPKTLELKKHNLVDTSKLDVKPLWDFVGLEDARLVNWGGKVLLTGVRRDTTTNGQGRMEISEVKNNKEISRNRIEAPRETYCEKNWMPILDMPNHYVKWTSPTEIVKVNNTKTKSKTIKTIEQDIEFPRDLRGGSQVIKYKDYFTKLINKNTLYINDYYDRAAQLYWIGGELIYSREQIFEKWNIFLSCFKILKYEISSSISLSQNRMRPRSAIRWRLICKHNSNGYFGTATNKEIEIYGISHAEFGRQDIVREFILIDEISIWKQILI